LISTYVTTLMLSVLSILSQLLRGDLGDVPSHPVNLLLSILSQLLPR
jgi:hypothetical protein